MTEQIKIWIKNNIKGDPVIWCVVVLLALMSIMVVYSATGTLAYKKLEGNTEYFLIKQTLFVLIGFFVMWIAHRVDYRYYAGISKLALWISVPLLLITLIFGSSINDANRWLVIPIINQSFQPSDLAKFALIANLASMLAKSQKDIDNLKTTLLPILLWIGVICGLIAMSDLSTATLLFSTCMLLMFIGRVPVKYLMMLVLVGVVAGTIALAKGQRLGTAISRIKAFADPTEVPYQLEQSYIAIAAGGVTGLGPGHSIQRNFLPSAYADFAYSIIIEEYGFIGGLVVLGLFIVLLYRGMVTVANSDHAFGGLLSAGLSFSLVLQAFVNMGVAVGLGPITGLPLPLISMGGTSLLFTGLSIGIILSVSRGLRSNEEELLSE